MKTIRFYNMLTENVMDNSSIISELRLTMPLDFDLNDMFDVLSQKTGYPIDSFSYETIELTKEKQPV